LPTVFSPEVLLSLSRADVAKALEEPRKLGLTSEGTAWTLKGRTIAELADRLGAQLRRQAQKDVGLG
jgi:hypothetical protein